MRRFLHDHARRAGLAGDRLADLLVAANEVATNSLVHGGQRGSARITPSTTAERGRGLWIVNQMCDLVELRSGPAGTLARLHLRMS